MHTLVIAGVSPYDPERTRIHPSDVNTLIRIGDSVDVHFNVTEPRVYPAELYYLMDVSYSMKNDMEKMKKLGGEIAKKEKSETFSKHFCKMKKKLKILTKYLCFRKSKRFFFVNLDSFRKFQGNIFFEN